MNTRKLYSDECKCIYTLNTWTNEHVEEAKKWLDQGYYVHFGSTAIGHTMANMVENQGIKMMKDIYGDKLEVIMNQEWGYCCRYCHIKQF